MESTLLFKDVLWFIGAITAIISFVVLITKPYSTLKDKIETEEKKLEKINNTIKDQQILLNSSLKVQLLLMQHVIYGNHTDTIKKKLEELEATIVDR